MLKKTITYEDFEGNSRTEDFYFNLSKAELVEMELTGEDNSFAKTLQEIAISSDGQKIIDTFKTIILKAYGEKSADGRKFVKTQELCDDFAATNAYSDLFVELATDAGAAAAFINGVVPASMAEQLPQDVELSTGAPVLEEEKEKTFNDFTRDELLGMSDDAFTALLPKNQSEWSKNQLLVAMQRKNKQ